MTKNAAWVTVCYDGVTPLEAPAPAADLAKNLEAALSVESLREHVNKDTWTRGCRLAWQSCTEVTSSGHNYLEAQVHSTSGNTYYVKLALSRDGKVTYQCSCPIDANRGCKHHVAVGLHLLGYPETTQQCSSTDEIEIDNLVAQLPDAQTRELLAWAAQEAPVVAAAVAAAARDANATEAVEALYTAVSEALQKLDYNRHWKDQGATAAKPLQSLLDQPSSSNEQRTNTLVAVAVVAARAFSELSVDDRYGDLSSTLEAAIEELAETPPKDSQRESLGRAVGAWASGPNPQHLWQLLDPGDYGGNARQPLLNALGKAGRDAITKYARELDKRADKASEPVKNELVAATRAEQAAQLRTEARASRSLLRVLTGNQKIPAW